jgi:hypothetical protein
MMVASQFAAGRFYEINYADGTRIVLDAEARHMWATHAEGATIEDTASYLLGPAMASH